MKNKLSTVESNRMFRLMKCRQILIEKSNLTVNDKRRLIAIDAEIQTLVLIAKSR